MSPLPTNNIFVVVPEGQRKLLSILYNSMADPIRKNLDLKPGIKMWKKKGCKFMYIYFNTRKEECHLLSLSKSHFNFMS